MSLMQFSGTCEFQLAINYHGNHPPLYHLRLRWPDGHKFWDVRGQHWESAPGLLEDVQATDLFVALSAIQSAADREARLLERLAEVERYCQALHAENSRLKAALEQRRRSG